MMQRRAVFLVSRQLASASTQTRAYCENVYRPYGSNPEPQTIFHPPALSPVPEDVDLSPIEGNFTYHHFNEMGSGSIIYTPGSWHLTESQDPLPDMMLHTDTASRWIISQEDVLAGETMKNGVVVAQFKHLLSTPHDLIQQVEGAIFGSAKWHVEECVKKGKALDKALLLDGYGVEPLHLASLEKGNRFFQTIETNVYKRPANPLHYSESDLEDWYTLTDFLYWKKERWVMFVSYQCQLSEAARIKPLLKKIRDNSIFNFVSPLYRTNRSHFDALTEFPTLRPQHDDHHDHHHDGDHHHHDDEHHGHLDHHGAEHSQDHVHLNPHDPHPSPAPAGAGHPQQPKY